MTPDAALWFIAAIYSVFSYLRGHQGSHLAWLSAGRATLNPQLTVILLVYHWLFFPWLF
jgi:hypothetical protein